MTRKELEDLGLEKEIIDAIMVLHGKTIESTKKELDVLKTANEKMTAEKVEFETKIKSFETVSQELENFKKVNSELQAKLDENEKNQKEASFNQLLIDNLKSAKVLKPETLSRLIDKSKIVVEDGKIKSGLNEQLEEFKTSDPYFFGESFGKNPADNPSDKLTDVQKILSERNPELKFK